MEGQLRSGSVVAMVVAMVWRAVGLEDWRAAMVWRAVGLEDWRAAMVWRAVNS